MSERDWRAAALVVMAVAVGVGVVAAQVRAPQPPPVMEGRLDAPPGQRHVDGATQREAVPGQPEGEGTVAGVEGTAPGTGDITVHVAGEVARPGLVRLPAGSRVADAIAAAGGMTGGSAPPNLAAPLADGSQVLVGGEGAGSDNPTASDPAAEGPVPVNRADATLLESLPGVGPVLAERIVAHRRDHGPFATVEDLLGVPGIGEAKLASLRDLVVVP